VSRDRTGLVIGPPLEVDGPGRGEVDGWLSDGENPGGGLVQRLHISLWLLRKKERKFIGTLFQCCGSGSESGSTCFLGLLDPDPSVRGMDLDPSITKQKQ
jgi:hypothetical protein